MLRIFKESINALGVAARKLTVQKLPYYSTSDLSMQILNKWSHRSSQILVEEGNR